MTRTSAGQGGAAYTAVNTLIWAGYVALIVFVVQVLAFADSAAIAVTVVIAALVFRPARRQASRAARRHFSHR